MGLDFLQYCRPTRAKASLINRLFSDAQSLVVREQGTINRPTSESVCVNLANPKAYNAATAYICVLGGNSSTKVPHSTMGLYPNGGTLYNQTPAPYYYYSPPYTEDIYNANNCKNIVGLLNPVKVSDYMAQKNYSTVTRVYLDCTNAVNYSNPAIIVDAETGEPRNETTQFDNYIVPIITWFYTDSSGNRQQLNGAAMPYYIFTATALNYIEDKSGTILGSSYTDYITKRVNITGDGIGYFMFAPPYIHTATTGLRHAITADAFLNSGCLYCRFPAPDTEHRQLYLARHSAPYVSLRPDAATVTSTTNRYNLYSVDVDGIDSTVGIQVNIYNSGKDTFPAYTDTQSIIDLFADYGVTITTDINTALNPPETDDGIINPDNPAEEMPFYPDNTTDVTPIDPAYVTPSTFAQARIYNPLTTRDFLAWICDNTVDVGNWARLFSNPVDVITGINLYNLDIVAHDSAHTALSSQTNILGVTTDIPNYAILDGYNNIIDGGTLTLQAYYGNYADFTSMTYQMFIPFVGFTPLRACDVINKTLHLYYAVDFATGSAIAFVNSDNKLIYSSPCTVAGKIPLSTSDRNSQMINNSLAVLGGLSGLLGGIASGNVGGGVGALMSGLSGLQLQTNYSNKGSLSAVNMYKLLPAFIERTRYDLFFPSGEQKYIGAKYQSVAGAPSTQFDTLLNCVDAGGFVQSDVVYLTSQTATETEKQQIIDLIKSGIYL